MGRGLDEAMAGGAGPAAIWDSVIASVRCDRAMWTVQYELVGQVDRADQLRGFLTDSHRYARGELATHLDSRTEGAAGADIVAALKLATRDQAVSQKLLVGEGRESRSP